MIKLNVGGFAGEVLVPVIADVPVLRNVLPEGMQKKSPSELAVEQAQAEAEAEAEATAEQTEAAAQTGSGSDMTAEQTEASK